MGKKYKKNYSQVVNKPVNNEPVTNEPVMNEPVMNEPVMNEPVTNIPTILEYLSNFLNQPNLDIEFKKMFETVKRNIGWQKEEGKKPHVQALSLL